MPVGAGATIPLEARLSNQYLTAFGVRFSSGAGYAAVVDLGAGHAGSGTVGIGGSSDGATLTYNGAFPITLTFVDPLDTTRQAERPPSPWTRIDCRSPWEGPPVCPIPGRGGAVERGDGHAPGSGRSSGDCTRACKGCNGAFGNIPGAARSAGGM